MTDDQADDARPGFPPLAELMRPLQDLGVQLATVAQRMREAGSTSVADPLTKAADDILAASTMWVRPVRAIIEQQRDLSETMAAWAQNQRILADQMTKWAERNRQMTDEVATLLEPLLGGAERAGSAVRSRTRRPDTDPDQPSNSTS